MHHIALLLFDTTDARARQETLDLARVLIDEAAADGYGEYRFHEVIKHALDPNSILAPGKSGIWGRKPTSSSDCS